MYFTRYCNLNFCWCQHFWFCKIIFLCEKIFSHLFSFNIRSFRSTRSAVSTKSQIEKSHYFRQFLDTQCSKKTPHEEKNPPGRIFLLLLQLNDVFTIVCSLVLTAQIFGKILGGGHKVLLPGVNRLWKRPGGIGLNLHVLHIFLNFGLTFL